MQEIKAERNKKTSSISFTQSKNMTQKSISNYQTCHFQSFEDSSNYCMTNNFIGKANL